MKNILLGLTLVLGAALSAHASNVAVVDSGTDFAHQMLKNNVLINTSDMNGNRVDDDRNGKVDDINGWNFVNGSNKIFTLQFVNDMNPITFPLFRVIAHQQGGTNTPAEDQWYKDNVTSLTHDQKVALVAHVNYFGEWMHSTHVSGIIVGQNPKAMILSAKIFPDEPPPLYNTSSQAIATHGGPIDWIYKLLAAVSNQTFSNVATYLNERHIDVANYSIGVGLPTLAKASLALRGNSNPTEAQVAAETTRLYVQFEAEGKKWMASSPNTLFVIAAGNDGTNNDEIPAFPANIRNDNSISVAATQAYQKLAFFSNYGATTVDVAAPGVAILSTVPSLDQNTMLPLSGTSMACPFVTGVASRVKDANPKLTPKELRTILMGTVDHKDWLVGKVVSGGVVNPDRAAEAGRLSATMDIDSAIKQAVATIADQPDTQDGPQSNPETHSEMTDLAKLLVF